MILSYDRLRKAEVVAVPDVSTGNLEADSNTQPSDAMSSSEIPPSAILVVGAALPTFVFIFCCETSL